MSEIAIDIFGCQVCGDESIVECDLTTSHMVAPLDPPEYWRAQASAADLDHMPTHYMPTRRRR